MKKLTINDLEPISGGEHIPLITFRCSLNDQVVVILHVFDPAFAGLHTASGNSPVVDCTRLGVFQPL